MFVWLQHLRTSADRQRPIIAGRIALPVGSGVSSPYLQSGFVARFCVEGISDAERMAEESRNRVISDLEARRRAGIPVQEDDDETIGPFSGKEELAHPREPDAGEIDPNDGAGPFLEALVRPLTFAGSEQRKLFDRAALALCDGILQDDAAVCRLLCELLTLRLLWQADPDVDLNRVALQVDAVGEAIYRFLHHSVRMDAKAKRAVADTWAGQIGDYLAARELDVTIRTIARGDAFDPAYMISHETRSGSNYRVAHVFSWATFEPWTSGGARLLHPARVRTE